MQNYVLFVERVWTIFRSFNIYLNVLWLIFSDMRRFNFLCLVVLLPIVAITCNPTAIRVAQEDLLCCPCRLVTNNLCVSTWRGAEEYCRAEPMAVILGVVDSTVDEMKQKNLLSWLPGIQTDWVGWTWRLSVPCQAWEQVLKTEYNYYIVRLKHWHGLKDLQCL